MRKRQDNLIFDTSAGLYSRPLRVCPREVLFICLAMKINEFWRTITTTQGYVLDAWCLVSIMNELIRHSSATIPAQRAQKFAQIKNRYLANEDFYSLSVRHRLQGAFTTLAK